MATLQPSRKENCHAAHPKNYCQFVVTPQFLKAVFAKHLLRLCNTSRGLELSIWDLHASTAESRGFAGARCRSLTNSLIHSCGVAIVIPPNHLDYFKARVQSEDRLIPSSVCGSVTPLNLTIMVNVNLLRATFIHIDYVSFNLLG